MVAPTCRPAIENIAQHVAGRIAMLTWATSPFPKNVPARPFVRSKNWSGIRMSSGLTSCFMLPTAEADRPYAIDRIGILSTAAFGMSCSVMPVE
jgi:hypothetical protein